MKKKLRTIIALLKSRAYLDSQREAAERKHSPRDVLHHEYEQGQKETFQPATSEDQRNARVALPA
jgi:hypothetical protein